MKSNRLNLVFLIALVVAIALGAIAGWQVGGIAAAAVAVAWVATKMRDVTDRYRPPAL